MIFYLTFEGIESTRKPRKMFKPQSILHKTTLKVGESNECRLQRKFHFFFSIVLSNQFSYAHKYWNISIKCKRFIKTRCAEIQSKSKPKQILGNFNSIQFSFLLQWKMKNKENIIKYLNKQRSFSSLSRKIARYKPREKVSHCWNICRKIWILMGNTSKLCVFNWEMFGDSNI